MRRSINVHHCIGILVLLSGVKGSTSAEQRTFCRENRLGCTTRQVACLGGRVINVIAMYFIGHATCQNVKPGDNRTAWIHCCCQDHITDRKNIHRGYGDDLRLNCDNRTECNVYGKFPLKREVGKVTIYYKCTDPNIHHRPSPDSRRTKTTYTPNSITTDSTIPHRTSTNSQRKTTSAIDVISADSNIPQRTSTISRTETTSVPDVISTETSFSVQTVIIVSVSVTITSISVIIAIISFRKRRSANQGVYAISKTIGDDRPVHELCNQNDHYYAIVEPHDNALDDGAAALFVVAGDGCGYSVVNQNYSHMRADVHGSPGVYDSVSMTQKNPVRSNARYDHVVHRAPGTQDMTYDHVGDLKRKLENTDIDNTYNTCVAHDNYSLTTNKQQRGVFKIDEDDAYAHITPK